MADFTVTLANGWALRARIEQVTTHVSNVSPRASRQRSKELQFAIWDDETKSGVTIDAADAQVLLGMHALANARARASRHQFQSVPLRFRLSS